MTDQWFDQMAKAMQQLTVARNGLARWQEKVTAAEERIETLTAQRGLPAVAPTPEELAQEVVDSLPAAAQPTFGVTVGQSPFSSTQS
jgi:hypothetical protein